MKSTRNIFYFFTVICLFTVLISSGAYATTVISNSHVWQDKYLSAVHAGHVNATIISFQNLADAQLKIKTVAKDDDIILLESKIKPVVKNFANVLSINGYTSVKSYQYDTYIDLQSFLLDELTTGSTSEVDVVVLDPAFAIEAIVIAPKVSANTLQPLFLSEESQSLIETELKSGSDYLVGHFPIRTVSDLAAGNAIDFTGDYAQNQKDISEHILSTYSGIWGVLMRPDITDLSTLGRDIPIFLYTGSVDETAKLIKNSQVMNLEVIGGSLGDTSKAIEQESGKDLRILLKYGRTVTQVQGLEGQILNLDAENFPFPYVEAKILDATYYKSNGKLAIRFQNTGNIPALIFSNVEFGTQAITDNYTYAVPANSIVTIAYDVEDEAVFDVTINTQYGEKVPLLKQIQGDDGRSFVKKTLIVSEGSLNTELEIYSVQLDTKKGILYVNTKNLGDVAIQTHIQFPFNETITVASNEVSIPAGERMDVEIPVPYISNEDLLDKQGRFIAFQGSDQTIYINAQFVGITKKSDVSLVILVIIIVGIVAMVAVGIVLAFKKKGPSRRYKSKRRR